MGAITALHQKWPIWPIGRNVVSVPREAVLHAIDMKTQNRMCRGTISWIYLRVFLHFYFNCWSLLLSLVSTVPRWERESTPSSTNYMYSYLPWGSLSLSLSLSLSVKKEERSLYSFPHCYPLDFSQPDYPSRNFWTSYLGFAQFGDWQYPPALATGQR